MYFYNMKVTKNVQKIINRDMNFYWPEIFRTDYSLVGFRMRWKKYCTTLKSRLARAMSSTEGLGMVASSANFV